ncbi:MAG TPA: acylphosphatase [Solirubrobacteraceae bacterium]|jgi:acylphosphatase|nr:acylphosphatase [Solirubrobacteraceae bacterium]
MAPDTIRRRLVVHGKVQGVFFRDSTREAAANEGVAGWARNRGDGTVEVVLEGPPAAVQAVTEFCRLGPVSAHVDHVDVSDEAPEGLTGFEIRG